MKKHLSLAIILMALATILSIAIVSCKKNDQSEFLRNKHDATTIFDLSQIDDVDSYLRDFKQKMLESKEDTMLTLSDASWHLSSVANHDYGDINAKFEGLDFDTIYGQVNITNGAVLLSDLGSSYIEIAKAIENQQAALPYDVKHIRFIDASIGNDGLITIPIMTTYSNFSKNWGDTLWYFPYVFGYADSVFYHYFGNGSTYVYTQYNNFANLMQYALNMESALSYVPTSERVYYVISRQETLFILDYIDPFGSPSYNNSRILGSLVASTTFSSDDAKYYFDSYLGLGKECNTLNEFLVVWLLENKQAVLDEAPLYSWYMEPVITYGMTVINGGGSNDD